MLPRTLRVAPWALCLSLGAGGAGAANLAGCEKDEPKKLVPGASPSAGSAAPAATPAPTPPAAPSKPQLAVDESGASVGGDRVGFDMPDVKGRLALALEGKPVAGEEVVVDAARDTKVPKVAHVFAALAAAKAKAVRIRTADRDRKTAEIPFVLGAKRPDCTAVVLIGKDGSLARWTAGGSTALKQAHGMAGIDLTLGPPAIRKLADACDAPVWAVSGEDNVTWGLIVDLVLAVQQPGDAGAPWKRDAVFLATKPTPGRKVDAD
jgi:biopolymer transport protein ExbD